MGLLRQLLPHLQRTDAIVDFGCLRDIQAAVVVVSAVTVFVEEGGGVFALARGIAVFVEECGDICFAWYFLLFC